MANVGDATRPGWWTPVVNLLLPGGGLILAGAIVSGLIVGVLFALCANFALAAVLLFPDDFSTTVQALAIGAAGGAYVGAQLRLAYALRDARAAAAARARREQLWQVRALIEQGRPAEALPLVSELARAWPDDLLVAYRLAQVLTAAGTPQAARAAWGHVRALDRHGVYRAKVRAGLAETAE